MPSDTIPVLQAQEENTEMALDERIFVPYQNGMVETPLKIARSQAGLSQQALADLAGTSQPQIKRLERGERKLTKEWAERLAPHLNETPQNLIFEGLRATASAIVKRAMDEHKAQYRDEPRLLGPRDLKVFVSAECGPGEMHVTTGGEPYELLPRPWYVERDPLAFGVVLTGDSMEPVYEAGEIVIVSPKAPLIKGKDAVFTGGEENGDFRASLKRYRGMTERHYLAKQFNPEKDLQLDRALWANAYRVLGTFDG